MKRDFMVFEFFSLTQTFFSPGADEQNRCIKGSLVFQHENKKN